MHIRFKKRSRAQVLGILLIVSIVAALLPWPFTGSLGSLLQVLVPLQHTLDKAGVRHGGIALELSADEAERLYLNLKAKQNQIAVLNTRIAELETTYEEMSRIRNRGLAGGRLIPARVVASDSLPWRESRLVDRGTLAGVGANRPVISGLDIVASQQHGVTDGMSVLSGEILLGEVCQVYTHTARVMLVTDPDARHKLVRIGRHTSGGFHLAPAEFLLYGAGNNRMIIRDVAHNFIESQQIQVGDTVVTSANDPLLPVSIVVGQVVGMRRDDDNGVLYHVLVAPAGDLRDLRRVYVIDVEP